MKNFKNYTEEEILDMIDYEMEVYNKKQYEVLRELAIDSRYIGMIRHKLGRQLKTKTSTLQDRICVCKDIIKGYISVKEAVKLTGYTKVTIYKWLKDYTKYGDEMLQLATGFNHYKG